MEVLVDYFNGFFMLGLECHFFLEFKKKCINILLVRFEFTVSLYI